MKIKLVHQSVRWELRHYTSVVQHSPLVTVPGEDRRVDPISMYLSFIWSEEHEGWDLAYVEMIGTEVLADDEYGDSVNVSFYDPTRGMPESDGGFPEWVRPIADEIAAKLPTAPAVAL